jgi:hypothetical protein
MMRVGPKIGLFGSQWTSESRPICRGKRSRVFKGQASVIFKKFATEATIDSPSCWARECSVRCQYLRRKTNAALWLARLHYL